MTSSVLIYGAPPESAGRLEELIRGRGGFRLLDRCPDDRPAVDLVDELSPDILVLGFGMTDRAALNALAWVRAERLPVRVIIGAAEMSRDDVVEAMTLNIDGLLPDTASDEQIAACLSAVVESRQWLSPVAVDVAAGRTSWDGRFAKDPLWVLTEREIEVALEVARGPSNQQAAENLGIKLPTLKLHLHRIYARLKVANRHELAQLVARRPLPGVRGDDDSSEDNT